MRISDWSSDVCSSDLVDPPAAQNGYYESVKAGAGTKIQPYPTIILRSVKQELSAVCNMARPNMVPRRAGDHILMLHFFEKTGDIQFQPCPCFTWNIKPIIEPSFSFVLRHAALRRA